MADSSEVANIEPTVSSNSGGDTVKDDDNKPRIMKRSRAGDISSSTDNTEDSEPDEKRPAFRLQPPTLIHGKAKPVPKTEESSSGTASGSTKCKFLQPSKLSGLTSSGSANTSSGAATKPEQPNAEPQAMVSSSNPFLLMAEKDPNEESQKEETNPESAPAVNGTSNGPDENKPDSTTEVEAKKEEQNNDENLFAQAANNSNSKEGGMSGFLFGSKMEDRVVINSSSDQQSPDKSTGDVTSNSSSGGFVFGQNLSERAKVSSSTDSNPSFLPPSTEGSDTVDGTAPNDSASDTPSHSPSSSSEKKQSVGLKEDAEAHFRASQARPKMPEIEVLTGEEDEKSVLQIQCKLHQFEATNQNWLERGVGSLHLNDGKYSEDNLYFQSRLVMRVHGSLRLVLNTKIWPSMTVEKASKKSVRVSAQTDDGSIGVFLITATINDAEQMFRALEYRVLHQKQLEEKRKELENKKEENNEEEDPKQEAEADPNREDEEKEEEMEEKKSDEASTPTKKDQCEPAEIELSPSKKADSSEEKEVDESPSSNSAQESVDNPL